MKHPERNLQIDCANFLTRVLQPSVVWTAIGHGVFLGSARAKRGALLKAMGVKPGVPDMMLTWDARPYWSGVSDDDLIGRGWLHTLWLELKSKVGRMSSDQIAWSSHVQDIGHHFRLIRSLDDLATALIDCAVPTRIAIRRAA